MNCFNNCFNMFHLLSKLCGNLRAADPLIYSDAMHLWLAMGWLENHRYQKCRFVSAWKYSNVDETG